MSEEDVIKGCRNNDETAQKQLYEMYAGQLLAIAYRYAASSGDAEDVLQDTFVKVFDKIDQFKGTSAIFFWMKRILVNTALNSKRNKLYMYPMVPVENLNEKEMGTVDFDVVQLDDLLTMIQTLPDGCRTVFNLYGVEGYKHQEIAKMLNINEGTSRSQYARAKRLLQDKIRVIDKNIEKREDGGI